MPAGLFNSRDSLEVKNFFTKKFGYPPAQVVRAPGRLEILGNHTESSEGLVMSAAVDRYIYMACSPRPDGRIELHSSSCPEREVFWVSDLKKNPAAPWADYVKGVLTELRRQGVHFSGFNAAICGTIPLGAGLGSSAALGVASALTVRQLFPFRLTETGATTPPRRDRRDQLPPLDTKEKLQIAKLCQAAETRFVGGDGGLVDPLSSLFGKAYHVVSVDGRFLSVTTAPLVGEALVLCPSGVRPERATEECGKLRQQCEAAARALGAKTLRSVELSQLKAGRAKLTQREYLCAYHVVSEIQRVVFAERALDEDDHFQFGQYLFQSHESSRDYLRNSCPELDLLVELAKAHPGCLGARLTGRGFGGATINLVKYHQVESFMEHMATRYRECTGSELTPLVCQMVDGAE